MKDQTDEMQQEEQRDQNQQQQKRMPFTGRKWDNNYANILAFLIATNK